MMLRRSGLLMDHRELESVRPSRARVGAIAAALGTCFVVGDPTVAWAAAPARASSRAAGGPRPAAEGSGATEPGALRVKVEPRIDDATSIPQWIAERSAEKVSRLGEQPGHQRWVEVRIGGETYAYRVTVTAMRDGKPVVPSKEPVVCECTSEELLAVVDGEVQRAVEELERPVGEEPVEPEPTPAPTPNGEQLEPEDPPPPRWLLPTGAALTAVGGAGLITGVVMAAVGERPIRAEGIQIVQGRDWRSPAGYAVLGVGAGVMAGGVTLLVLHHIACKRAPGSCGGKTTSHTPAGRGWAVMPWVGGSELGMGVVGRFSGRSK